MKSIYFAAAVATTLVSSLAFADDVVVAPAAPNLPAADAAAGAAVGGPVGAVVGGAVGTAGAIAGGAVGTAGAIVGSILPPQPSVVYAQPVAIGETLPDTIVYYDVPNYPPYEYVVLNNERVIVDRHHRVVRVMQ